MMEEARAEAGVDEGVSRNKGCTIRFGEYVLITEAAAGVHMTCDYDGGRGFSLCRFLGQLASN